MGITEWVGAGLVALTLIAACRIGLTEMRRWL
jgi:hypothetical protein